jgi:hypothetical protein
MDGWMAGWEVGGKMGGGRMRLGEGGKKSGGQAGQSGRGRGRGRAGEREGGARRRRRGKEKEEAPGEEGKEGEVEARRLESRGAEQSGGWW